MTQRFSFAAIRDLRASPGPNLFSRRQRLPLAGKQKNHLPRRRIRVNRQVSPEPTIEPDEMTKKNSYKVAMAGATGTVGEALLAILKERQFPIGELVPLASERSAGGKVDFGNRTLTVGNLADYDFAGVDSAFFSAGGSVSREHAPRAAAAGAVVIDNTSEFRYQDDIPLVVSEVNPHAIAQYQKRGIIANPNCSTMQMLVALAPIHRAVGITRINVATYQSVSGAGRSGLEELGRQTAALLNFQEYPPAKFSKQIAFNVIPHIDEFQANGYTKEEMKMVWETRKILEDPSIAVNATAVRVPVFYGHSEAVHVETRDKITAGQARALLETAPGVTLMDEHKAGGDPTPVGDAAGNDAVFVGRIREDISHPRGLDLWVVSDNIRKGAALNAVQIGEILAKTYL
jgi:aspartate-semialdehyde dehydrogenase